MREDLALSWAKSRHRCVALFQVFVVSGTNQEDKNFVTRKTKTNNSSLVSSDVTRSVDVKRCKYTSTAGKIVRQPQTTRKHYNHRNLRAKSNNICVSFEALVQQKGEEDGVVVAPETKKTFTVTSHRPKEVKGSTLTLRNVFLRL